MYYNRKLKKAKGYKVSVNHYHELAVEQVASEFGMMPSTLVYKFAFDSGERQVTRMQARFRECLHELMYNDSMRVA